MLPYYHSGHYSGMWYSRSVLADSETSSAIKRLVGEHDRPLEAICGYQKSVKKARLKKKHKVITDRIDAKMRVIADTPSDFDDWIDNTGFGEKRYFFYRHKDIKYKDGFCTVCRSDAKIEKPYHKKYG